MSSFYSGDHIAGYHIHTPKHVTLRSHNRSAALERSATDCWGLNMFYLSMNIMINDSQTRKVGETLISVKGGMLQV